MHFANHYKKFQWKQSRRLAVAHPGGGGGGGGGGVLGLKTDGGVPL